MDMKWNGDFVIISCPHAGWLTKLYKWTQWVTQCGEQGKEEGSKVYDHHSQSVVSNKKYNK